MVRFFSRYTNSKIGYKSSILYIKYLDLTLKIKVGIINESIILSILKMLNGYMRTAKISLNVFLEIFD